eukprot:TRINITY_DN41499_c0_g1_i1.p1 TRINITY_DN41499_c0_g1~~TRINITY_DN41499_c0_g1_i1.p1  ORF type:complete len:200 (-),score=40.04 TRINITY_DN41499_c0_g1_i1:281-880(-)
MSLLADRAVEVATSSIFDLICGQLVRTVISAQSVILCELLAITVFQSTVMYLKKDAGTWADPCKSALLAMVVMSCFNGASILLNLLLQCCTRCCIDSDIRDLAVADLERLKTVVVWTVGAMVVRTCVGIAVVGFCLLTYFHDACRTLEYSTLGSAMCMVLMPLVFCWQFKRELQKADDERLSALTGGLLGSKSGRGCFG